MRDWIAERAPCHEFERDLFGLCAKQFGSAHELLDHPVSVAGVRIHTLDAAGHAYADDEDTLLIMSDHGMYTEFYLEDDGTNPASYSWHAYASMMADNHPESVSDAHEWIETRVTASGIEVEGIDMPTDQLRELGYLE